MSTYIVGDLQGCCHDLTQLLATVNFNASHDRLWCVGDLINRGPDSLNTLRLLKNLAQAAICVLGNHDLHALAVYSGIRKSGKHDTLNDLFNASDAPELMNWLRHQRLAYSENDILMIHAGVQPSWSLQDTLNYATEIETALRSDNYANFLNDMYGNFPATWHPGLLSSERARVIVNTLTRLRFCQADGTLDFSSSESADTPPENCMPWFDIPNRQTRQNTIVFGHWSTLGLRNTPNLIALDTGCVWGGSLSCLRLEDRKIFQVKCNQHVSPWHTKEVNKSNQKIN